MRSILVPLVAASVATVALSGCATKKYVGREVGEIYASIHSSKGVDVRTGTKVEKWQTRGKKVQGVTLSDGRREDCDMVLLAVGIDDVVGAGHRDILRMK